MITTEEYKNQTWPALEHAIENHIDNVLRNADGKHHITIQVLNWDRKTLERVLARYRDCGWICDVVGDWRDGDYISMVLP